MFRTEQKRLLYTCYKHTHLYISECDQEMPQSQTTDQPRAPRGRDTEHSGHKTRRIQLK